MKSKNPLEILAGELNLFSSESEADDDPQDPVSFPIISTSAVDLVELPGSNKSSAMRVYDGSATEPEQEMRDDLDTGTYLQTFCGGDIQRFERRTSY